MVELNGIAIARMKGDRIGRMWVLWESMRAEVELKPDVVSWKWPPWK